MRRRTVSIAGGTVAAVVAAGLATGVGWSHSAKAPDRTGVEGRERAAASESPTAAPAPRMITRAPGSVDPGLAALTIGTLVVTPNGCIALHHREGEEPQGLIWGAGWSAGWEDGKAVVYDRTGAVFARQGDQIGLGGGGAGTTPYWASLYGTHPCWTANMFEVNNRE